MVERVDDLCRKTRNGPCQNRVAVVSKETVGKLLPDEAHICSSERLDTTMNWTVDNYLFIFLFLRSFCPLRLTFTWWGCCGLRFDVNQPSLPSPFHSVLVSISAFMAFSTVFHSINSPDNSPLSHSVPPVLFLPYWSFQLYTSL